MQSGWRWRVAGVHRMRAFVRRALSAPARALLRAALWPLIAVLLVGVVLAAMVLPAAGPPGRALAQSGVAAAVPEPTATTCGSSPLEGRTQKVVVAIVAQAPGVADCASVTATHLSGITSLSIANQSLTALQSGDFAGLTHLRGLYLGNNQLSALPAGLFGGLSRLRKLYLGNNWLSVLPAALFAGLSQLQELGLADNRLSTVAAEQFAGLTQLQKLYLGNNRLSTLAAGQFAGLIQLQELYLAGNQLGNVVPAFFNYPAGSELGALTTLWLGNERDATAAELAQYRAVGLTALTDLRMTSAPTLATATATATATALPAVQALQSFAHGAVVALQGTPHLWIADDEGVLHWGGDTRVLAGKFANWSDWTEVSLEQFRTLPVSDPWLSACGLLKDGDPIYLVKWETDWPKPRLLHIRSIKDVELFGINASNYGRFVVSTASCDEWARPYGFSMADLQRGVLPVAVTQPTPTPQSTATPISYDVQLAGLSPLA